MSWFVSGVPLASCYRWVVCELIVKPERQGVAGTKSPVSGIGIEVHGVSGGSARVYLRCAISISCEHEWAVAYYLW